MKTVSGKVVFSKQVSLSKAARILSKFASSDNGASPAFAAYLKRASASFSELVQLYKELKGSSPERKGKKHLSVGTVTEDAVYSVRKPSEVGLVTDDIQGNGERNKHKGGNRGQGKGRELEGCLEGDDKQKRHRNKRSECELSTGAKAGVQKSEGSVNGNAAGVIDDEGNLKRKKKKDSNDTKDQTKPHFNVTHSKEVKNKVESEDGSKETRKKKNEKKKKIDESEEEKCNGLAEIEEEQSRLYNQDGGDSNAIDMAVLDDGSKRNKSGNNIKKKESTGIQGAKQRSLSNNDRNVKNEIGIASIGGGEGKKHMQIHGGEETESGSKFEIQEATVGKGIVSMLMED